MTLPSGPMWPDRAARMVARPSLHSLDTRLPFLALAHCRPALYDPARRLASSGSQP